MLLFREGDFIGSGKEFGGGFKPGGTNYKKVRSFESMPIRSINVFVVGDEGRVAFFIKTIQRLVKVEFIFVVRAVFDCPIQVFFETNRFTIPIDVFPIFCDFDGFNGRVDEMMSAIGQVSVRVTTFVRRVGGILIVGAGLHH